MVHYPVSVATYIRLFSGWKIRIPVSETITLKPNDWESGMEQHYLKRYNKASQIAIAMDGFWSESLDGV